MPGLSSSSSARAEMDAAVFIDGLADDLKAWSEAGIEVTYDSPNVMDERDQWDRKKTDRKYKTLGGYETKINLEEHMKLDCHVIEVSISDGYAKSYVAHWCKDFKRHEKAGKSELKHKDAKKVADTKVKNSTFNRDMREAKVVRQHQAQAWFRDGRVSKATTTALAVAEAGDHFGYDNAKLFAQLLLGLTPPDGVKGMEANSWYNQMATEWLDERAGDDADKRARLVIAGSMALQHIASSSSAVYNWYAPWLVEMAGIEIADDGDA